MVDVTLPEQTAPTAAPYPYDAPVGAAIEKLEEAVASLSSVIFELSALALAAPVENAARESQGSETGYWSVGVEVNRHFECLKTFEDYHEAATYFHEVFEEAAPGTNVKLFSHRPSLVYAEATV